MLLVAQIIPSGSAIDRMPGLGMVATMPLKVMVMVVPINDVD